MNVEISRAIEKIEAAGKLIQYKDSSINNIETSNLVIIKSCEEILDKLIGLKLSMDEYVKYYNYFIRIKVNAENFQENLLEDR